MEFFEKSTNGMDKDKQIKKEIAELNKLFQDIPADQAKLVEGLIQNAAFMRITLEELQQEVIENGAVIQCQSGNGFDTIKDNPAQKAYTTMVARYTQIINQLQSFLPEKEVVDEKDNRRSKLLGIIND